MVAYVAPRRALSPVLDLSAWLDGSGRAVVAREFDRIAREIGFFYLVGHGVPEAQTRGILGQAERFFAQPMAAKRELLVTPQRRGYEPLALQALDVESPPDLKEGFLVGEGLPADDPHVLAGLPNYGANRWPEQGALPGFTAACQGYFQAAKGVATTLMEVFAMVAGLPEGHFAPMWARSMSSLRLLHYPPQPAQAEDNQIGCGSHTDWGAVTVLLQDEIGGLEVQAASGEWLYADPMPGAFIVNLGDMMPVWTNGAYHSNPHRVRNRSGARHRYSVPFFLDPDYHAEVACLDAFRPPGEAPRLAPRTAGAHLDLMYQLTYGAGQAAA